MAVNKLLSFLLLCGKGFAESHHLFTSSFSTPHLFALEFDDQKNTLTDIANISAHDGHPWISFSYDKSNLYAGEHDGFASYNVINSTGLEYVTSIKTNKTQCDGPQDSSGIKASPYVLAGLRAPFTVFGASESSCGMIMNVTPEGSLEALAQGFSFGEGSSIKGMAFDPENHYLYSADYHNNGIWVHTINDVGTVNSVGFVKSPIENSGPRHLIAHPTGRYLYVILGKSNTLAVFAINSGTDAFNTPLTYTGLSYSLLPVGANPDLYDAEEVLLSADANVLYATTRYARSESDTPPPPPPQAPTATSAQPESSSPTPKTPKQPKTSIQPKTPTQPKTPIWPGSNSNDDDDDDDDPRRRIVVNSKASQQPQPGYITAILLTPYSEHENPQNGRIVGPGFPLHTLFQLATTTTGGLANSVSPAPWANDFFALADSQLGMIEIWKLENFNTVNFTGDVAQGAATPPVGGWVGNMWLPTGRVANPIAKPDLPPLPEAPSPTPSAAAPVASASSNPWFPTTWRPGGAAPGEPDPWAKQTGKGNDDGAKGGSSPWVWNGGGTGNADDDDDDRRRLRFFGVSSGTSRTSKGSVWPGSQPTTRRLFRMRDIYKRQVLPGGPSFRPAAAPKAVPPPVVPAAPPVAPAPLPPAPIPVAPAAPTGPPKPITARVVASWTAPADGGRPGRLFSHDEEYMDVVDQPVLRMPWTGNKKRGLPGNGSPSPDRPVADTREAYLKAAKEGKSCCANAVWFD